MENKSRKNTKPCILKVPIYEIEIEAYTHSEAFEKYYKRAGINISSTGANLLGYAWDIEDKNGDIRFLLCIPDIYDNKTILTIVHEVDHIAWMVLNYVGIQPTYNEHECHTYLMEHILQELQKKYYKL